MSTYLEHIESIYKHHCGILSRLLAAELSTITKLQIRDIQMGDVATQSATINAGPASASRVILNINVSVGENNSCVALITSDDDAFKEAVSVKFTDEMVEMYTSMMVGARLWHVCEHTLNNKIPSLNSDYDPMSNWS